MEKKVHYHLDNAGFLKDAKFSSYYGEFFKEYEAPFKELKMVSVYIEELVAPLFHINFLESFKLNDKGDLLMIFCKISNRSNLEPTDVFNYLRLTMKNAIAYREEELKNRV